VKKVKEKQVKLKRKKTSRTKAISTFSEAQSKEIEQQQHDGTLMENEVSIVPTSPFVVNNELFDPLELSVQSILSKLRSSDSTDDNSQSGDLNYSGQELSDDNRHPHFVRGFEPSQIYLRSRKAFGGFLPFLRETYTLNEIDGFVGSSRTSNLQLANEAESNAETSTSPSSKGLKRQQHQNFMKQTASTVSKSRSKCIVK
jgi:hypothetical protein